jgi:hypothetical protein
MPNQTEPQQDEEIIRIRAEMLQQRERLEALELVVSWLLAKNPDSLNFLQQQADELRGNKKLTENVALLDDLRDDVLQWHQLAKARRTDQG